MAYIDQFLPWYSYDAQPTTVPEGIMDAMRAYISAQGIKETGEYVLGSSQRNREAQNLDLRNQLLSRQLAMMPMDSSKLEDQWNDEPTVTSKIAKMLGTHYLEGITNPINKVGKYASRPTGIAAILARL